MSILLLRRHRPLLFRYPQLFPQISYRSLSGLPSNPPQKPDPRSNLSDRLSFIFDQIDAIDNRSSEKFDALQRIRQWRESRTQGVKTPQGPDDANKEDSRGSDANLLARKKDVEVVHPWPEWIELMERLGQQNYFDPRRVSENHVAESVGIDLSEVKEEVGFDFSMDWTTVRNACINFGKERFDILRSLSKKDIQILVGHGCPSMDPKVVFSAKLLRKYTHLDEGDVCSSCSLRNSCSRGYILTLKEDEARTLDVMRVLLTYGFDHVNGAVENKPIMQIRSVKTVIRKLLHEIVKLSDVPIDPNLPPPVIKKPHPKVKQPPPPPKKRVGRDDVEMKKGDWLCIKCDFMNFAKNMVCLQCDAKRPKRQLLPGEWECPQCNFLNYRRNMACFHCDAKRPPDEFTENQFQPKQAGPSNRFDRASRVQDVSNAWNFDFDDNESDGADVAAFEFADSKKAGGVSDLDALPHERTSESFDDTRNTSKVPRPRERGIHFSDGNEGKSTLHTDRTGFDDFDDEDEDDVDSYELDGSNTGQAHDVSVRSFSEVENTSGSEDSEDFDRPNKLNRGSRDYTSGSEDDEFADHPQLKSSHVAESWRKSGRRGGRSLVSDDNDDDFDLGSDYDDDDMDEDLVSKQRKNHQQSSGRKGISRGSRGSDSDDGMLLGLDSDGDDGDFSSGRNRSRGNKGQTDRRANGFRKSNDFGNGRTREFKSDDTRNNQRNSLCRQDSDFSSMDSLRDGHGGMRENNRVHHFDMSDGGNRRNDYGDRRGSDRLQRFDRSDDGNRRNGNIRNDYGVRRGNDRVQRLDRSDDGNRRNGFGDSRRNDRFQRPGRSDDGNRRNGYGGSRGNDRFQRPARSDDGNRRNGYGGRRGNDRLQRPDRSDDGNRRSGYDDIKGNDRFLRFDRSDDGSRRTERSNQFSDRSRGPRRDERGQRGDDGFQRERTSNFRDNNNRPTSNFRDNNNRPRMRDRER